MLDDLFLSFDRTHILDFFFTNMVQLDLEKTWPTKTTIYSLQHNLLSRGLPRTNRKIDEVVTIYHQEQFKKRLIHCVPSQ
jgi:hypothetical protein